MHPPRRHASGLRCTHTHAAPTISHNTNKPISREVGKPESREAGKSASIPPTRAGCHSPVMVIAQCNDCTLQSLPPLFFSLPRRVNHHTSASLHPPPTRGAPAHRNAAKTSPRIYHLPPPTAGSRDSEMQSLHNAITTLQHLFLSYPALISTHHCPRSSPPYRSQFITPPAPPPPPCPALATSLPCTQQRERPPPAPTTTPKNQQVGKPISREAGKPESWKVGKLVSAPPVPCRLPPAGNGDSTMQSQHSAITAQCGHPARARL